GIVVEVTCGRRNVIARRASYVCERTSKTSALLFGRNGIFFERVLLLLLRCHLAFLLHSLLLLVAQLPGVGAIMLCALLQCVAVDRSLTYNVDSYVAWD
ncbi:unnamed protein product, partial [Amoebophrya sp. A25]